MSPSLDFEPYLLTPVEHILCVGGIGLYGCNYFIFPVETVNEGLASLETGVSRLVRELPYLSGELAPRPGDARLSTEVRPASAAAFGKYPMLMVRRHDGPLPEDIGRAIDAAGDAKFRPLPMQGVEGFKPVVRFQANVFDGGIVLCVCWNHIVIDGGAVNAIFNALALCCREKEPVSLDWMRQQHETGRQGFFNVINRPLDKTSPDDAAPAPAPEESDSPGPESVRRETFTFAPDLVNSLKNSCTEYLPGGQYCATNDILMALVWASAARASLAQGKKCSSMEFPITMRNRAQPPIPETYIGATMLLVEVHCSEEELSEALSTIDSTTSSAYESTTSLSSLSSTGSSTPLPTPYIPLLATLASKIRQKVLTTGDNYLTQAVHDLHAIPTWEARKGHFGDLLFSNLSFNVCYKQDFGANLGHVQGFEPRTVLSGMTYIKPRKPMVDGGLGPWELTLMFDEERLGVMRGDALLGWVAGGL